MKYFVIFLVLVGFSIPAFAQTPISCNFGDKSTPLDEIFDKDIAAKAFTEKHQNATRHVAIEQPDPLNGEITYTAENKHEKEVLLIKFNQNENGCYRPYAYHYSFNNGIIDVTIRNSLSDFTEIINLIKSDDKKIEDFYTKNCNPVQLDFVLEGESKPFFCKYDHDNSIEMSLQKHIGGMIEVHIPDKVMDALFYNCVNDDFIVLNNGEEIYYELIINDDKKIFKMDLPSGYSKMEIIGFTYLGNNGFCGSIWSNDSRYISPLLQTKIGVEPFMVQCNEHLVLVIKYDGSPACVTEQTRQKLIERGWIKDDNMIPTFDYVIEKDGVTYGSQYQISGGTVDEIFYDKHSNSLVIPLRNSEKGFLQIVIQIGLLHSLEQMPFTYFVIVDGEEVVFEQLSPIMVKIPFEKGTKQIEIVGITEI